MRRDRISLVPGADPNSKAGRHGAGVGVGRGVKEMGLRCKEPLIWAGASAGVTRQGRRGETTLTSHCAYRGPEPECQLSCVLAVCS